LAEIKQFQPSVLVDEMSLNLIRRILKHQENPLEKLLKERLASTLIDCLLAPTFPATPLRENLRKIGMSPAVTPELCLAIEQIDRIYRLHRQVCGPIYATLYNEAIGSSKVD
jgi:hypothetical protein